MITAIDSSVLFCIFKGEPQADRWVDLMIRQAAKGRIVACEIVLAELGAYFESEKALWGELQKLHVDFLPAEFGACYLAGAIFRRYRSEGGKRDYLIPDFLVGAHALSQANALMAIDRGYLRRYFRKLKILTP